MTVAPVPISFQHWCDACDRKAVSASDDRLSGWLKLRADRDSLAPAGHYTMERDFCPACTEAFIEAFEHFLSQRSAAQPEGGHD